MRWLILLTGVAVRQLMEVAGVCSAGSHHSPGEGWWSKCHSVKSSRGCFAVFSGRSSSKLPHGIAKRCSLNNIPSQVNRAGAAWEPGELVTALAAAGNTSCYCQTIPFASSPPPLTHPSRRRTETRPGYDERPGCGLRVLIFATYSTGSNSTITALYSPSPIFSAVIAMPDSQKTSPAE